MITDGEYIFNLVEFDILVKLATFAVVVTSVMAFEAFAHSCYRCMTLIFQVLEDVTKDEFISIMELLKNLKMMNTVLGRQQLVDIVTEQAELDEPFEVVIFIGKEH